MLHGYRLFLEQIFMNMQLRQCFSRAKPFQLKKSQKNPDFVWLFIAKKAKDVHKRPEKGLALKKRNWHTVATLC